MIHGLIVMRYNTAAGMRGVWRQIATLLVLVVSLHQLVMAAPSMHMAVMAMSDGMAAQHRHDSSDCPPPCPAPVTSVCPAIQATLPHASGTLVFLSTFALIGPALILLPLTVVQRRTTLHPWLWPPDRRRAFLQVFLC